MRTYVDLDTELLERAERECMERPEPCSMWDDRLYRTHGPVLSWAERGDDILAESNYHTVLAELQGTAAQTEHEDLDCCWDENDQKRGWGTTENPHDDYVIDASISDWLVGSLRQIFVRVRDDSGEFTDVFKRAVEIAIFLRDEYSVFDESDYSEREHEAYQKDLDEALTWAKRDWADDTDEQSDAITLMFWEHLDDTGDYLHGGEYSTADWDGAERHYGAMRDRYYDQIAQTYHPFVLSRFEPHMRGQETLET